MDRKILKQNAKSQIKGKIGTLFIIELIIAVITTAVSLIPTVGSACTLLINPPFILSMTLIFLAIVRGGDVRVEDTFKGFSNFESAFKVNILVTLFTMLWSLLLIIPGVVKSYSYSMAMYILADNPGMGAKDAINLSKKMTEGHKMELFVLDLSFIGWILLSAITLGIGLIWVVPYINATRANVYEQLKGI